MFRRWRTAAAVAETAPSEEPTPPAPPTFTHTAPVVDLSAERLRRYKEQAGAIGFYPAMLKREEFMQLLRARGRGVYSYAEVAAFLDEQFGPPQYFNQTWGWRPLTEADIGQADLLGWRERGGDTHNGRFLLPGTYQGKVPFEVLGLVGEIREALPFVHFFVSDAPTRRDRELVDDPFLAASWLGLEEVIIIEHWDEPNFFGQSEPPA